jgi:hypothetical protein
MSKRSLARPDVFTYGFWLPRDSIRYQGEQMPWADHSPGPGVEPSLCNEDWRVATLC